MKTIALGFLLVVLTGCATSNRQARETINDRVGRVRIGMLKVDVVGLLGDPTKVSQTITGSGRHEQWIYTENTLSAHLLSSGQQMSYGFAKGMMEGAGGQKQERTWYFYFDNDVLTSMQN